MVKMVIAEADTKVYENEIKNASFIFLRIGSDLFYVDTTVGRLWKVGLAELIEGKDLLGDGHRLIASEMFK